MSGNMYKSFEDRYYVNKQIGKVQRISRMDYSFNDTNGIFDVTIEVFTDDSGKEGGFMSDIYEISYLSKDPWSKLLTKEQIIQMYPDYIL